ncbi:DNA cytosine methyltransferase [Cryobacterium algoricola]|uniref:Cytosine-specific methyltransferase n=1 Tax=Cryobacterium algoricola TaxID=1259183 RepID=A0ABY2IC08_9MICO|nr:DNA cytosine methyltransferase [Cryobacterium algoricola]TFB84294.1 DNA cytosine methyltransferase [Cryobacterium algoricola]
MNAASIAQTSGAFTYVDLFAGCGGLSLGLRRAGGTHVMAVEKSPMASETYFKNQLNRSNFEWRKHLERGVTEQGAHGLIVGTVESLLDDAATMSRMAHAQLDLVAGGPPCQGFSLAGRRRSSDPRNQLAWQFLRFVDATNPRFVIIENVVGMHRKFHATSSQSPFDSLRKALAEQGTKGYRVQGVLVNAKHYGAPQSRPRMMLIGVREDVAQELGVVPSTSILESGFSDESPFVAKSLLPRGRVIRNEVRTVAEAIGDLDPGIDHMERLGPKTGYIEEISDSARWHLTAADVRSDGREARRANTELRSHRPSTVQLFRLLKILKRYQAVAAARKAKMGDFTDEASAPLREIMARIDFPVSSPDGILKAENEAAFFQLIRDHLTLKHSQTVLDWTEPSRTVVTIPDDYIHPLLPRTFSVRELARLQGFPDAFEFYGKVTTGGESRRVDVPQYSQVGNAVSPFVGTALGSMVSGYVKKLAVGTFPVVESPDIDPLTAGLQPTGDGAPEHPNAYLA